jgi:autotransporter-associated beta strand protein
LVSSGSAILASYQALGATAGVTVNGGNLNLSDTTASGSYTVTTLNGTGGTITVNSNGSSSPTNLSVSTGGTFGGVISDTYSTTTLNGAGSLTVTGANLTLTGSNTYTGGTNINSGTLNVGSATVSTGSLGSGPVNVGTSLGGSGTLNVYTDTAIASTATATVYGGSVTFYDSSPSIGALNSGPNSSGNVNLSGSSGTNLKINNGGNFSGEIIDNGNNNGSVTLAGGTLSLSGVSNYGGGTTVSGATATLLANGGALSTGTGPVTVSSGGRLGGIGTITNTSVANTGYVVPANAVSINAGGIISPGVTTLTDSSAAGVGTLNTNDMIWNGGKYVFKTNVTTGAAPAVGNGNATDLINITGSTQQDALIINGVLDITATTSGGTATPFTILIASHSSGVAPSASAVYTIAYANQVETTVDGVTTPVTVPSGQTVTLPSADFVVSDDSNTTNAYTVVVANDPDGAGGYDVEVVAPEPNSIGLLGVASLGLLRRRRRSQAVCSH